MAKSKKKPVKKAAAKKSTAKKATPKKAAAKKNKLGVKNSLVNNNQMEFHLLVPNHLIL